MTLLPFQHHVRRQFRAVVADHHAGVAPHLGDPVQFASDPDGGDRGANDRRYALPIEAVDQTKDTEPAAIRELVRHEVERPLSLRSRRAGVLLPASSLKHLLGQSRLRGNTRRGIVLPLRGGISRRRIPRDC